MENKMMVMRMALRDVSRVAEEMSRGALTKEPVDRKTVDAWAMRLCEIISRDLAIPLRNCDVGTVAEQTARMRENCNRYKPSCKGCKYVTDLNEENCWLAWAQSPYDSTEADA